MEKIKAFLEGKLKAKELGVESLLGTSKNFKVIADGKKYILKIFPGWPVYEVKYEFDLLDFMSSINDGPQVTPNIEGFFEEINNHPAILLEYMPGKTLDREKITKDIIYQTSKSLTIFHENLRNQNFGQKNRLNPFDLEFLQSLPVKNQDYLIEFLKNYDLSDKETLDNLPQTIIHDDLSKSNILITSYGIKIIDTSESHKSCRISDISTVIFELLFTQNNVPLELINVFIDTYNQNCSEKVNRSELMTIPFLITRRCLFIMGYYTKKLEESDEYTEYVAKYVDAAKSLRINMSYLIDLISRYE